MATNIISEYKDDLPTSLTTIFTATADTIITGMTGCCNRGSDKDITIVINRSGTDNYLARRVKIKKDQLPFSFKGHQGMKSGDILKAKADDSNVLDFSVTGLEFT